MAEEPQLDQAALRVCPIDGQRLATIQRGYGQPTVFTHVGGYQHGDLSSQLPPALNDPAEPVEYDDGAEDDE